MQYTYRIIICFLGLLYGQIHSTLAGSYYCNGGTCLCLNLDCTMDCTTESNCQNNTFICTNGVNSCHLSCIDDYSCSGSTFYVASDEFTLDCDGQHSCDDTTIYCGMPDTVPSHLDIQQFSNSMETCDISVSALSMHNSYISCNESIQTCHVSVDGLTSGGFTQSQLDCSLVEGNCQLDCNEGCYDSSLICDVPSSANCQCNGCTTGINIDMFVHNTTITTSTSSSSSSSSSIASTDSATESSQSIEVIYESNSSVIISTETPHNNNGNNGSSETVVITKERSRFDLTDGHITNLEILYYIIMGAGGCVLCCVLLCCFIVCIARKQMPEMKNNKESKKRIGDHVEFDVYSSSKKANLSNLGRTQMPNTDDIVKSCEISDDSKALGSQSSLQIDSERSLTLSSESDSDEDCMNNSMDSNNLGSLQDSGSGGSSVDTMNTCITTNINNKSKHYNKSKSKSKSKSKKSKKMRGLKKSKLRSFSGSNDSNIDNNNKKRNKKKKHKNCLSPQHRHHSFRSPRSQRSIYSVSNTNPLEGAGRGRFSDRGSARSSSKHKSNKSSKTSRQASSLTESTQSTDPTDINLETASAYHTNSVSGNIDPINIKDQQWQFFNEFFNEHTHKQQFETILKNYEQLSKKQSGNHYSFDEAMMRHQMLIQQQQASLEFYKQKHGQPPAAILAVNVVTAGGLPPPDNGGLPPPPPLPMEDDVVHNVQHFHHLRPDMIKPSMRPRKHSDLDKKPKHKSQVLAVIPQQSRISNASLATSHLTSCSSSSSDTDTAETRSTRSSVTSCCEEDGGDDGMSQLSGDAETCKHSSAVSSSCSCSDCVSCSTHSSTRSGTTIASDMKHDGDDDEDGDDDGRSRASSSSSASSNSSNGSESNQSASLTDTVSDKPITHTANPEVRVKRGKFTKSMAANKRESRTSSQRNIYAHGKREMSHESSLPITPVPTEFHESASKSEFKNYGRYQSQRSLMSGKSRKSSGKSDKRYLQSKGRK